jgi:hypothetical protein
MEARLPKLRHPTWMQAAFLIVGVVLTLIPVICGRVGFGWFPVLFFAGLMLGVFFLRCSPSLAVALPFRDQTVGDLVKDSLAINHARFVTEVGGWNQNDVWEALCRVIVMQLDIDREMIKPEALIVDHLGID